jgi:beta-carotene ketolase (CrtW type)
VNAPPQRSAAARDPDAERAAVRDLAAVRPPRWAAALNLALGAVFLASIPLGFFAVDGWPLAALVVTPWLVFCFTGLFILAHEAIHQTLVPGWPRLGHAFGWLFAFAFVFMDYGTLRARHSEHHGSPGRDADPDAHPSGRFLPHFASFLYRYLRIWQVALLVLAGNAVGQAGHTRAMLCAYVAPAIASTLIVFAVGIFLVHHPKLRAAGAADERHRSVGVDLGGAGSLLAILFFNTHWLHHEHPQLNWLQLGLYRSREPRWVSLGEALRTVLR